MILLGNSFDIFTTLWIYINETHLIADQCHPSIVGPREWSHLEKIFFESFEYNEKLSKTLKTLLSMAMAIGTCDIWSIPYLMFNDCDQWNFMIRYYRGVSVIDKLNTPATFVPVFMIFWYLYFEASRGYDIPRTFKYSQIIWTFHLCRKGRMQAFCIWIFHSNNFIFLYSHNFVYLYHQILDPNKDDSSGVTAR